MMGFILTAVAGFKTFGRHINLKNGTPEYPNIWLFLSMYVEMIAVFMYLFFVIHVNVNYLVAQLCPYWTYL